MQDTSYIERFIEKDFHDWKDNWADSRTLLVKGCRQVGKTTSVRHFAAENYKYVIYVDVRSETDLSLLESASESNVVERLTAFCEAHSEMHAFINSPDTVLILDEVQENKAIYERIRTFNRSLDCHVIFTGSNLKLSQDYFQPAGDCFAIYAVNIRLMLLQCWGLLRKHLCLSNFMRCISSRDFMGTGRLLR